MPETEGQSDARWDAAVGEGSEAYCWKLLGELRQQIKWLSRHKPTVAMIIMSEVEQFNGDWWRDKPTATLDSREGRIRATWQQAEAQSDDSGGQREAGG